MASKKSHSSDELGEKRPALVAIPVGRSVVVLQLVLPTFIGLFEQAIRACGQWSE
jgi:hypothetical protein